MEVTSSGAPSELRVSPAERVGTLPAMFIGERLEWFFPPGRLSLNARPAQKVDTFTAKPPHGSWHWFAPLEAAKLRVSPAQKAEETSPTSPLRSWGWFVLQWVDDLRVRPAGRADTSRTSGLLVSLWVEQGTDAVGESFHPIPGPGLHLLPAGPQGVVG